VTKHEAAKKIIQNKHCRGVACYNCPAITSSGCGVGGLTKSLYSFFYGWLKDNPEPQDTELRKIGKDPCPTCKSWAGGAIGCGAVAGDYCELNGHIMQEGDSVKWLPRELPLKERKQRADKDRIISTMRIGRGRGVRL
jgi:hypothetical protein